MKIFNMENIEFVVVNQNKKFNAVYNKHPHIGGSLGNGSVDDAGYITCPLHNWQFDLETEKGSEVYEDSVPTFELDVRWDSIFINQNQLLELGKNKDYLVRFDHNTK
jgi:nitrite reductase/ring-hydroxylating ferredoxin subunit